MSGGFAPILPSWLRDRAGDNQALSVDLSDGNDFDGVTAATTVLPGKYCCLTFPR